MSLQKKILFAAFCLMVAMLTPSAPQAASASGCDEGSPAWIGQPPCPDVPYNNGSCDAGSSCTDAFNRALAVCDYWTNYFSVSWPGMVLENFDCTDPVEPEEFGFSFVCAHHRLDPCIED
jgi:hypothetical protein